MITENHTRHIREKLVALNLARPTNFHGANGYDLVLTTEGVEIRDMLNEIGSYQGLQDRLQQQAINDSLTKLAKERYITDLHDRSQSPVQNKEQIL